MVITFSHPTLKFEGGSRSDQLSMLNLGQTLFGALASLELYGSFSPDCA